MRDVVFLPGRSAACSAPREADWNAACVHPAQSVDAEEGSERQSAGQVDGERAVIELRLARQDDVTRSAAGNRIVADDVHRAEIGDGNVIAKRKVVELHLSEVDLVELRAVDADRSVSGRGKVDTGHRAGSRAIASEEADAARIAADHAAAGCADVAGQCKLVASGQRVGEDDARSDGVRPVGELDRGFAAGDVDISLEDIERMLRGGERARGPCCEAVITVAAAGIDKEGEPSWRRVALELWIDIPRAAIV